MASSSRRSRIPSAAAALLMGSVAAGLIVFVALELLGSDLEDLLRSARDRLLGREAPAEARSDELFRDDAKLGWRPIPNVEVRATTDEYDITYRIDEAGGRRVPDAGRSGPVVLTLGGSFTFGHGVEDDETWPSTLQARLQAHVVRNLSANGWGTAQCMLALDEALDESRDIDVVIYGFTYFHVGRNDRRKSWLEVVGKDALPLFEVRDGHPVFRGLIGPSSALPDDTPALREREWEITDALLRELSARTRAAGARFVVVLLPWRQDQSPWIEDDRRHMRELLAAEGIASIDLMDREDLRDPALYYEHDGHPKPAWHAAVAASVADFLDE